MALAPSTFAVCDHDPALREVVIAIPVRNEAQRLPRLLQALSNAAARTPLPVTAIFLANNCTDGSENVALSFRHPALSVRVISCHLADPTAGLARRMAFDLAARDGALIMTTDADAVPHPNWITSAMGAASAGADVVCGRVLADLRAVMAAPQVRRVARLETAYRRLLHETRHALDSLSGRARCRQPHYIEAGASLAIRAECYRQIGGMPEVRSSEDRALVHRAEQHGLRIDYAPAMTVTVSARLCGRAEGGMAETLRSRISDPNPLVDQAMLPLPVVRQLWHAAITGRPLPYPSRADTGGWSRLRASDLETALPDLRDFVRRNVRPYLSRSEAA